MLYLSKLEEVTRRLKPEFEKLFIEVLNNQNHIGDLLLVYHNFSLNTKFPNLKGYSPYIMGLGFEGFSERTHYEFIDTYRKNNLIKDQSILVSNSIEELSIQIEMLIYLKIWECDLFIKKIYQIVQLLNGKAYDWNFTIAKYNNDKSATGTRQKIIREKIRDNIKSHLPILHESFKSAYNPQIRNAIAHSQYYFLERSIGFNNFDHKNKYSNLNRITFEDWSEIFHKTIIIYNEYILLINKINPFYVSLAKKQNNKIPFIMKKDLNQIKNYHLEYLPEKKRWQWID